MLNCRTKYKNIRNYFCRHLVYTSTSLGASKNALIAIFNSHAAKGDLKESAYVDALLNDLSSNLERYAITRPLHSIFIGGGTPSLFTPEAISRLLEGIRERVNMCIIHGNHLGSQPWNV